MNQKQKESWKSKRFWFWLIIKVNNFVSSLVILIPSFYLLLPGLTSFLATEAKIVVLAEKPLPFRFQGMKFLCLGMWGIFASFAIWRMTVGNAPDKNDNQVCDNQVCIFSSCLPAGHGFDILQFFLKEVKDLEIGVTEGTDEREVPCVNITGRGTLFRTKMDQKLIAQKAPEEFAKLDYFLQIIVVSDEDKNPEDDKEIEE